MRLTCHLTIRPKRGVVWEESIGAKIVTHARCVIFQMAEVAVLRELFQEILRLIDGLRPRPVPA
jgi:hypothetical protein